MPKLPVATSKKPVPVKIVNDAPSTAKYADEDKKWRAESDLRTIKEFAELSRDKTRLKAAKGLAKQQMSDLKKCL